MKIRAAAAASAAALIMAAVYIVISRAPAEKAESRDVILDFSVNDVTRAEFDLQENSYSLVKADSEWKIEGIDADTDEGAVNGFFGDTLPMEGKRINNPEEPSAYGFDNPRARVEYTFADGKKKQITLGANTPSDTEAYVTDGKDIYTVYTQVSNALSSKMYSFIDSFIAGYEYEKTISLEITNSTGRYTLFHSNGKWTYAETGQPADEFQIKSKITRYLGGIYMLRCYVKNNENMQKYGFDQSSGSLKIKLSDNTESVIRTGMTDGNELYIIIDEKPFIYCVDGSCFSFLAGDEERQRIDRYGKE